MKDLSAATGKTIPLDINIGTAGKDTVRATARDESVIKMLGKEKPDTLNQVLHVPDVERGLVSVSSLCEDGATV